MASFQSGLIHRSSYVVGGSGGWYVGRCLFFPLPSPQPHVPPLHHHGFSSNNRVTPSGGSGVGRRREWWEGLGGGLFMSLPFSTPTNPPSSPPLHLPSHRPNSLPHPSSLPNRPYTSPPLPNTRSPVVRILLVTKKSGNRERCRKLSL